MATEYFSDNEAYITNQPLPTPSDTPYQTPFHSLSRRPSRYGTPSNDAGPMTAPLPPDPRDSREAELTASDNVSLFDPRRFTPTLHANLVSEILNLRRELESKHKFIDDLETNFHGLRNENESLVEQLSKSTKENRTAKRQLQQLENGTLSALEEIASDRDHMKELNADLKEKLEIVQKKLRSQEQDSTRVHDMWASEKESWMSEKRLLERRVHISESRLKLVLEEIAAHEATKEEAEFDSESDLPRDNGVGPESEAGSLQSSPQRRSSTQIARHSRNISNSSWRSFGRNYRMSNMSGFDGRSNGINLADELAFDEEEEEFDDLELDSDDFPEHEMRARKALESRQSMRQDDKAKRILGLSTEVQSNRDSLPVVADIEPPRPTYEKRRTFNNVAPPAVALVFPPPPPEPTEVKPVEVKPVEVKPVEAKSVEVKPADVKPVEVKPKYVDTGVQPSPPPSPVRPETPRHVKPIEAMSPGSEVEANQRKKRVSATTVTPAPSPQVTPPVPRLMTSSSSQTVDEPLSPPATPVTANPVRLQSPSTNKLEVASISTQTDVIEEIPVPPRSPRRAPPPVPIQVPSIAIHAPTSAPPSPKEPILPPGTKSISTQTSTEMTYDMCSTGMQTEPIRIDQRPVKLPPHLLPSAIRSTPGTPEPEQERLNKNSATVDVKDSPQPIDKSVEPTTAAPVARQDIRALLEKIQSNTKFEDRYPGNNDNGPLSDGKDNGIRRPFRSSSLFVGFDGLSDDDASNADMSEDDDTDQQWSAPMLSSRNVKNGRVFNNPPTPVPEEKEKENSPARVSYDSGRKNSPRNSMEWSGRISKASNSRVSLSRQPSIRRSALIHSGTATHTRSQSPSMGSRNLVPKPPFPVPMRSSSRNVPVSKSEGSQSPGLRSSGAYPGRRPYGQRHQRQDSIRKVRSAAVMNKQPSRQRSRSPPLPVTPTMPSSPSIPSVPFDIMAGSKFGHRHQPSSNTTYTGSASVGSSAYQTSVVDAIAIAMVGEWMWKYVRKRKAFGGQETSPAELARGNEESILANNGVRHKRWVWISPYERSVLWSNKQPTTGNALLGKSGRKLTIQSVLDVADNAPAPKGTEVLFNRSILILTPARALKFTTVSRERHYMWLTALSFLAHSGAPIPELLPPPEEELPQHEHRGATLRRSHVRDSVRLAKGRVNPVAQRYQPSAEPLHEAGFLSEQPLPAYADPPIVPRGPHGHGRKRSSTGPSAVPPNIAGYRSFSHNQVPSVYSTGSSDMYSSMQPPSVPSSVYNPHSVITSTRPSESSTSTRQHFFDTMGTVRMEAFIDDSIGKENAASKQGFAASRMAKRRGSQWSSSTNEAQRGGRVFEDFTVEQHNDPFHNF